ncbi:MAG: S24/S26 family peptidase [Candidatus Saccharimonadales bacterium]
MTSPQSLQKPKKPKLPFAIRRVSGRSMEPTLLNGQLVVVWRWAKPRPGSVVVVHHNGLEKIKRIQDVKDGQIYLLGDNPLKSTDSRQFGWLPVSHVQGRVVGRRLNQPEQRIN